MKKRRYDEREEENEDDLNAYAEDVRESMLECDAIDSAEEAFMRGYEDA